MDSLITIARKVASACNNESYVKVQHARYSTQGSFTEANLLVSMPPAMTAQTFSQMFADGIWEYGYRCNTYFQETNNIICISIYSIAGTLIADKLYGNNAWIHSNETVLFGCPIFETAIIEMFAMHEYSGKLKLDFQISKGTMLLVTGRRCKR